MPNRSITRSPHHPLILFSLVLLMLVLSACGDSGPGPGPAPVALATSTPYPTPVPKLNSVTYIVDDAKLLGPDGMPPGWTKVTLQNNGTRPHQLQFVLLSGGQSVEELNQALWSDPRHPPEWAKMAGGPNAAAPGESSVGIIDLAQGYYAAVSLLPDAQGIPESVSGLARRLSVTEENTGRFTEPAPDLTIEAADFEFKLVASFSTGAKTILVNNTGTQSHEMAIVQLAAGATLDDYLKALQPGSQTPPPGKPFGGLAAIEPGTQGLFTADFKPGTYALLCFLPDPKDGSPHYQKGMKLEFTIK